MFDPIAYMQILHDKLKLTKTKYLFTKVSGIDTLEGILQESKRNNYFFAVDNSQDGETFRGNGGGYFERRPYSVFILGKAEYGNMTERETVLAEAKTIYRQLMSRLIKDKLQIPLVNLEQVRFYEVPPAFATGCSGLYFVFYLQEPVNLVYNAADWDV